MKITFSIRYGTEWGQQLGICGDIPALGSWDATRAVIMEFRQPDRWEVVLEWPDDEPVACAYKYVLLQQQQEQVDWEWGADRQLRVPAGKCAAVDLNDSWRSWEGAEKCWFTDAFVGVLSRPNGELAHQSKPLMANTVHRFQVYAPLVEKGLRLCLIGSAPEVGAWQEQQALIMDGSQFPLWQVDLKLDGQRTEALDYKYGLYDPAQRRVVQWEAGENRRLIPASNARQKRLIVQTDNLFRYPKPWRGVGIAIPVFSLRSQQSWGVGEFHDLQLMVDWVEQTGQRMIQILPINDTVATHSWKDSYPYAAISVFALHPIYLHAAAMCRYYDRALPSSFQLEGQALNLEEKVDYERVMKLKSRFYKWLYDELGAKWQEDPGFKAFFAANEHWLIPYAAFSCLRDRFGTPDFHQWKQCATYDEAQVYAFCSPEQPHYDDIAIHYLIQYHLHRQLSDVRAYARKKGIALKGDLPIGIYRHSVDAWVAPERYHMDRQAGAPPDDFAVKGQNWGFPTYNWEQMAEGGYTWWRARLGKMAEYFDAYRIDHILGFFRIWEIPYHSAQGLLGHFNPCLPIHLEEFAERGIFFDEHRFCQPYIRDYMLEPLFQELAPRVREEFLCAREGGRYLLKQGLDTQRAIQAHLNQREDLPERQRERLQEGLFRLVEEVLFLPADGMQGAYNPRIAMQHTYSFQALDDHTKQLLNACYNDYFYHRHEDFWRDQALTKLPPIMHASRMLVCGEDLGMVPACVPDVMEKLSVLSLRIQRMPHQGEFGLPANAPYLSVVTPSSHDMPTIRGWWEEDRSKNQRFFEEILGFEGEAPYYLEPWVAEAMLRQHLHAPSMWTIFPLQDLLAMDGDLRWVHTHEERINVPAIANYYWRYRMHLSLEELLGANGFNEKVRHMIQAAGR